MKRWTLQELETMSDIAIIRAVLQDRIAGLNEFAPLTRKIKQIDATLSNIEKGQVVVTKVTDTAKSMFAAAMTKIKSLDKKTV